MPSTPTEFTLNADLFRLIADSADVGADMDMLAVTGLQIYFDPDLDPTKLLSAATTPRAMMIKPERVTGYIRSNGRMYDRASTTAPPGDVSDAGNVGVRLLASGAELNLETPLTYTVSSNTVTVNGAEWGLKPWHIPAPTTDVTVDLASLMPVSRGSGKTILRGPAGAGVDAVRLVGSDIVFSYQGVDLPVPLHIAPASVPDGSVTTVKIVDANVTLAKLSSTVQTSLGKADTAAQVAGDLSGSAATPTVAKVNGVAVTGTPTAGQVPTATSGTAAVWQTPAGGVLTTAGDIIVRDATSPVRKAVGTNSQVLRVNTANADKLEYATLVKADVGLGNVDNTSDVNKPVSTAQAAADALNIAKSIVTTKGDIIAATAASTPARLPIGTDNQVLTADSTQASGVRWGNAAGGYTDPLTTAGDIVVRNASGSTRKAVGTNTQVLRVNTGNTDKLEWATLTGSDVGLGNVNNTSDANKPVSTAQAAADTAALASATGRAVAFALVF